MGRHAPAAGEIPAVSMLSKDLIVMFRRLAALLLFFTAGAICPAQEASANRTPNNRHRVVILGDSITAGYGLERSNAYPALLQQKADQAGLPYEIVNAGVSGDTTAGGLRRIDWAL